MYVGFVVFLIGCSILSGNILSALCPLILFLILDRMFIPYEEEKMEATFGEEYLEYKRRVRRWLYTREPPNWRRAAWQRRPGRRVNFIEPYAYAG